MRQRDLLVLCMLLVSALAVSERCCYVANNVNFWSQGVQKGANFFNEVELRERLRAAKQFGYTWIRLTPSKWVSHKPGSKLGDFLIGAKGQYQGLIKKDLAYLQ